MEKPRILFWNVDTQKDFIHTDGKLYVQRAETIKCKLEKITNLAAKKNIQVVNTADYHFTDSAELDENPDFIKTFPEHCMAGTEGAEFINETAPKEALVFNWDETYNITKELLTPEKNRNIIIRKDAFDVFEGNPATKKIIAAIAPDIVIVYGVTTNVCVDFAVTGLASRVKNVYVVSDAIKELPNIGLPFQKWETQDVQIITYNELEELLLL